jgi:hypothetical protein
MHRVGSAGLMVHEGQAVLGVPLDEPNPIGPSDEHDGPADSVHRVEEDRQSAAQTRQRQRDTLLRLQQSCAEVAEEVERKKRKLAEALRDQRNLKLRMRELDGHAPSRGGGGGDGSSVDAEPALPLPHGAAELSGLDAGALFADAAMSEIFSEEVSASIAAGTDSAVEAAEWDERCGLLTDEHEEWCEDAKFFTVPNICPFVKKCYEVRDAGLRAGASERAREPPCARAHRAGAARRRAARGAGWQGWTGPGRAGSVCCAHRFQRGTVSCCCLPPADRVGFPPPSAPLCGPRAPSPVPALSARACARRALPARSRRSSTRSGRTRSFRGRPTASPSSCTTRSAARSRSCRAFSSTRI